MSSSSSTKTKKTEPWTKRFTDFFSGGVWLCIFLTLLFLLFSGSYIGGFQISSGPISLAASSIDTSFGYDL